VSVRATHAVRHRKNLCGRCSTIETRDVVDAWAISDRPHQAHLRTRPGIFDAMNNGSRCEWQNTCSLERDDFMVAGRTSGEADGRTTRLAEKRNPDCRGRSCPRGVVGTARIVAATARTATAGASAMATGCFHPTGYVRSAGCWEHDGGFDASRSLAPK